MSHFDISKSLLLFDLIKNDLSLTKEYLLRDDHRRLS